MSCSLPGILQVKLKPTSLFITRAIVQWLVDFIKVHSDKSLEKGCAKVFIILKQFLLSIGFPGKNSIVLKKKGFSTGKKVHQDRLNFTNPSIQNSFCLTHSFLSGLNTQYILYHKFIGRMEPVIMKYHFMRGP